MPDVPEPRRPRGPRDPGDAWVEGAAGRFWGRFGAAGLLAHDPARGVLLQHRVHWSDHGGTWGLPGGARHQGEGAASAALREAAEEASVPPAAVTPLFTHVLDHGYWSYTTLAARVTAPFEAEIADPESVELRWVPTDAVAAMPLHPAFEVSWPLLRPSLEARPCLVVDVANVMGSRPDGWWRDRRGAAERILAALAEPAGAGVPASALGLAQERWWPRILAVVEGQARDAAAPPDAPAGLEVVRAPRDGDQAIVDAVAALDASEAATVVTADRALRARVEALGAAARGPGWLWALLPS